MTASATDVPDTNGYAATVVADPEPRLLASNLDVDVCVVGGGIAGLSAAYALARRGWSVAVLESDRIGAEGTAGGTGVVAPGFCEPAEGIVARIGPERARTLWELSAAGVARVRETIEAAGLTEAVAPGPGVLLAERADREAAVRRSVDLIGGTLGVEAEYWPSARVREVLRSGRFYQAVHFPHAFHVQPLHYVHGLADAARRLGVRIYEMTPVRRVDAFGIRKQVDTADWRVRARHIVLAGPGDLGALHPHLAGTVLSLSYPVGVTTPLGERLGEALRFAGAAVSGPAAMSHRIVVGDRLLWAGMLTTRRKPPRRLAERIGRAILHTYPQLAGVTVEHAGYIRADYTAHRMPQIGALAPGLWLAAAFGHHGIATATMAGDLIAQAILDGDDRWRLFRSYGLVWTGGVVGRAIVGATLSLSHVRVLLRERKTSARLPPPEAPVVAPAVDVATAEVATVEASASTVPPVEPAVAVPAVAEAAAPAPSGEQTVAADVAQDPPSPPVQASPQQVAEQAAVETSPPAAPAPDAPTTEHPPSPPFEPPASTTPKPVAPSAAEPPVQASAPQEPATAAPAMETSVAEAPSAATAAEAPAEAPVGIEESAPEPIAAEPEKPPTGRKKKADVPRRPRQKKPQGERVARTGRQSKTAKGKLDSKAVPEEAVIPQEPRSGDTTTVPT